MHIKFSIKFLITAIFSTVICFNLNSSFLPEQTKTTEKSEKYFNGVLETVNFSVKEGADSDKKITRSGYVLRRNDAAATILICHGFMCDKKDISFLRLMFKDYNVMTFDFRAHGENTLGQCCSFGRDEAYDVIGAAEFIKSDPDLNKVPLIVYGFSMGAVASILAQNIDPKIFAGGIYDCPFESSEEVLRRLIEYFQCKIFGYDLCTPMRTLIYKYRWNQYVQETLKMALKTIAKKDATVINTCMVPIYPAQAAKSINTPALFIVCKNDEKAPVEAVRQVYDSVTGYKRLWITDGPGHFGSIFCKPEEYSYRVDKFIRKILDGEVKIDIQQKVILDSEDQDCGAPKVFYDEEVVIQKTGSYIDSITLLLKFAFIILGLFFVSSWIIRKFKNRKK